MIFILVIRNSLASEKAVPIGEIRQGPHTLQKFSIKINRLTGWVKIGSTDCISILSINFRVGEASINYN
jgi:hypothetical protein